MTENAPDMYVWTDENGNTVVGTQWLQDALPDPLLAAPPMVIASKKAPEPEAPAESGEAA